MIIGIILNLRMNAMSKQRTIILEELRKLKTHPTAAELYPIVKAKMPSISLGTVYRNLNYLADEGIIQRIELAGKLKRFDGFIEHHYHFRCHQCNKIYDLTINQLAVLKNIIKNINEHIIEGYNLEFYGICNNCRKKKNKL